MTLSEYVKKKNGVPFGHPNSLRNNLNRSLGAKNFHSFWTFWNPIFSYYLGTKIFKPTKKLLPNALALVFTFICCGLIHDIVTTLFRQRISLFFTVWFTIMVIGVLLSKHFNYDLSNKKWLFRALFNIGIVSICLVITLSLNAFLHFY